MVLCSIWCQVCCILPIILGTGWGWVQRTLKQFVTVWGICGVPVCEMYRHKLRHLEVFSVKHFSFVWQSDGKFEQYTWVFFIFVYCLVVDLTSINGLCLLFLFQQDCIGNFDYLQELDCKNNHLRRLPSTIGNLRKLLVLNLTNNYITELPVNIGQLLLLEELCVQ